MPGANLTQQEAAERAAIIKNVDSYQITLDVASGAETYDTTTTVKFDAVAGKETFLDLVDCEVESVTLNGVSLDPAQVYHDNRIGLPNLQEHNVAVVKAKGKYSRTGEGLHRFVDPVDNRVYLYTQFEVPDARRVFANFEQPDLKSVYQLTVVAPSDWQVVSIADTPTPVPTGKTGDIGVAQPETSTWTFEPTPRLSTYLVALVAGPYARWDDSLVSVDGRTIPLGVYCRQSLAEYLDPEYIFNVTKQGFEFYERADNFNYPYPFAKYDQLFVPEFNMGAMENPGCVTHTEAYVFRGQVPDARKERRVVTILHELAHMWFGDLVTMKWWNDLWLNESFAEFASTLATAQATEWEDAWATFCAHEKVWAYHQDALPSTHPIVADVRDLEDVYTNFDGITYAKGGSVLKQLVVYVGRAKFFQGLSNYFRKYAYSNAVLADLLAELEATSGRDLKDWAAKWLETSGTNTLTPEIETAPDGTITKFNILQTAPADYPTIRPHRLSVGYYNLVGDKVERTHQVSLDVDGPSTEVTELLGTKMPDLVLLNDDDLTFAKIRFDKKSREFAQAHLGDIVDPVARGLIWAAMWDEVYDAEAPSQEYLPVILNHLLKETNSTTVQEILGDAYGLTGGFADPAKRKELRQHLGNELWRLVHEAKPGTDTQFSLLRAYAGAACTPEQTTHLRELLDGKETLPGLEIDQDLRWDLLAGLARNDALVAGDLEAEEKKDATATGVQAAARVRASIPTAEAKEKAFASIVDDDSAPNAVIRSTAQGWTAVNDPATLQPFLSRYIDALQPIWDTRSYQMADELISGLYPGALASEELRAAVQGWLDANPDAAPAFRRLVIEELADTNRALAAQKVASAA